MAADDAAGKERETRARDVREHEGAGRPQDDADNPPDAKRLRPGMPSVVVPLNDGGIPPVPPAVFPPTGL
jgi:hypothetical protein